MYRTMLAALMLAATAAPLFAGAPSLAVLHDDMTGNPANAEFPAIDMGPHVAKAFVPGRDAPLSRVEVMLAYSGPGAECTAELRGASPDYLPGPVMAKAGLELVAGQTDYSFEFAGTQLIAGQQYFVALHAGDAFSWLGDADQDGLMYVSAEGGMEWTEVSGFLTAMRVLGDDAPAFEILGHPADVTVVAGESATLQVEVAGKGPFAYQWFMGEAGDENMPIEAGTESYLTVVVENAASYWVRVADAAGNVLISNTAKVSLMDESQPQPEFPTIMGQAFTLVRATGAKKVLVGVISGSIAEDSEITAQGPKGLRVSGVRVAGQGIYADILSDRVLAEGEYMVVFTLTREDGITVSFEALAVITPSLAMGQLEDQVLMANGDIYTFEIEVMGADADAALEVCAQAVDQSILQDIEAVFSPAGITLVMSATPGVTGKTAVVVTLTDGFTTVSMEFNVTVAEGMILSASAPAAQGRTADDFDGGCTAGAGGGLAALALAALPVISRRRRK